MAATQEMKDFCLKICPDHVALFLRRRTDNRGGLDVKNQMDYLGTFLPGLLNKTKVSLFIDPDFDQIYASKKLGSCR